MTRKARPVPANLQGPGPSDREGRARATRLPFLLLIPLLAVLSLPGAAAGQPRAGNDAMDRPSRERARHREILVRVGGEVLLVPFQTERNGFDLVARSLMTRYLHDRLRHGGHRLPSPTLVHRALGEGARTFDDAELFRLANDMKAGTLIVPVAGHDLEERLHVTVAVYRRPEGGMFGPGIPSARFEIPSAPFGDETPPEEAFRDALDARLGEFPVRLARPAPAAGGGGAPDLPVPADLPSLVGAKDAGPVGNALRLQMLAIFTPREGRLREAFFERSLVAIDSAGSASPDARLLRARAWYHLHRRPASVAALPQPRTPEEKAFAALQDGDLPSLEREAGGIRRPLMRLLSGIEENDLRWQYDTHLPLQERYDDFGEGLPGWKSLLAMRLQAENDWHADPVLSVKEVLDNVLPVPGYTARGLAAGRLLQGRSPAEGEEVDLSVEKHRDILLQDGGTDLYGGDDSDRPVTRDILDLLREWGEESILKRIRVRSDKQALPEEALQTIEPVEQVFRGDPAFSVEKARALWDIGRLRQDGGRKESRDAATRLSADAFYRIGGQTPLSDASYRLLKKAEDDMTAFSTYNHDYPRRPYWYGRSAEGGRKRCRFDLLSPRNQAAITGFGLEKTCARACDLLYSKTGFDEYSAYFEQLVKEGGDAAGDRFLAANPRRFAGHRKRPAFLAGVREKRGDVAGARAVYEEAVAETPMVWEPLYQYGQFLMRRGEFGPASEVLRKYPLFAGGVRPESENQVAVSNYAFNAGNALVQRGALDEGKPLLEVAAGRDTGSGSEMRSRRQLAFLGGDARAAIATALEEYRRYETRLGLRDYLSLLFLMDVGEKAWQFLDATIGKTDGSASDIWVAAGVGLRKEGKDSVAVAEWFRREPVRKAAGGDLPLRLFLALTADRAPDPALPDRIQEAQEEAAPEGRTKKQKRRGRLVDALAEGQTLLRAGNGVEAFALFRDRADFFRKDSVLFGIGFPLAAMAAASCGRTAELEPLLAEKGEGFPFATSLSRAILYGTKGEHGKAVESLRKAAWNRPGIPEQTTHPFYQLLETAEWLLERTKAAEYRAFLVEWARKVQRINPALSWAFAFEAKHTDNLADRTRALALALYMDPLSERIAGAGAEEKGKAREWLALNNPFTVRKEKPSGI